MLRRILVALLSVLLFLPLELPAQKGGGHSSSSRSSSSSSRSSKSTSSRSKSTSSVKPVHVREYKRKDGTVVTEHNRSLPGTKTEKTKSKGKTKISTTETARPSAIPRESTIA